MLSKVIAVALVGACGSESPADPPYEPAVIVEAFPGGVVIYQGDDGVWQRAPAFGDRFGFDVTERYGVALVDLEHRTVDALFTTVAEQSRITWPAPPVRGRNYQLTGTAALLGELPGRLAGPLETVGLFTDEPYMMTVPEGSNTLAFGRISEETGRVESVILRRDVPIAGDLTMDVDFTTEGLRSTSAQVRVSSAAGCKQRSVFTFQDTSILLDARPNILTFPHSSLWLATDYLTFEIECGEPTNRATLFLPISREHLVPTDVDGPIPMASAVEFSLVDERFHFGWSGYFFQTHDYELTVSCAGCARWTSRMTEPWLAQFAFFNLDALSPPDLAALDLLDPALALPASFDWSVTAHVANEQRRVDASRGGRFTR